MSKTPPAPEDKSRRFPDGFRILQGKQEYITYLAHSSIRVWPFDAACSYDAHYHSAVEIMLVSQGEAVYTLSDTVYTVTAGQILILPPGCAHSMAHGDGTVRYLYLFEPHVFNHLLDLSRFLKEIQSPIYITESSPIRQEAWDLLMQVADIYVSRQPMWNALCYAHLVRLYALLGKDWVETKQEESANIGIESEMMNSVLAYIGQHYTENLHLDDVAAFSGFSKYYFSRAFKKFFGLSFTEYLCRCRLDAAMDLLIHTRLPIRQVAEKSGFGSVATFNRIFRSAHACSPSRYRSLYGEQ